MINREDVASRIVALHGMGMRSLARVLNTTVPTLDRIVCSRDGNEATYARILPRLQDLEQRVAAFKSGATAPQGSGPAGLLAILEEHAREHAVQS